MEKYLNKIIKEYARVNQKDEEIPIAKLNRLKEFTCKREKGSSFDRKFKQAHRAVRKALMRELLPRGRS